MTETSRYSICGAAPVRKAKGTRRWLQPGIRECQPGARRRWRSPWATKQLIAIEVCPLIQCPCCIKVHIQRTCRNRYPASCWWSNPYAFLGIAVTRSSQSRRRPSGVSRSARRVASIR